MMDTHDDISRKGNSPLEVGSGTAERLIGVDRAVQPAAERTEERNLGTCRRDEGRKRRPVDAYRQKISQTEGDRCVDNVEVLIGLGDKGRFDWKEVTTP